MIYILLALLVLYLISCRKKETFRYVNCPRRNMSYDLRGEAYVPPIVNFPFRNSEIIGQRDCIQRRLS